MKFAKTKTFWITVAASIAFGWAMIGLAFLISSNYTLQGWTDAVLFGFIILFAFAWLILVAWWGFFDMLFYGTAAFATTLFSRKKKMRNYYEYTQREKKVDKSFIGGIFITSLLFLIAGIILLILN